MRGLSIILEDVVISCLVTEICKRHRKLFALGGQTYGLLLVDEEDMLLSAEKALLKMKEEKSLSSGESRTLFVKKFFKKVFPELPSLEERRRVLISPQKSWKDRDLVILWRDLADYPDLLPLVCEVFLIEVYTLLS